MFSPDDLTLVKGGPADRRRFLDDTLVALAVKYDALRLELDRIVRQRNTLLRQAGGRLDESAAVTLDVWDAKLGRRRRAASATPGATLVERLRPMVGEAYDQLAGAPTAVGVDYDPAWRVDGPGRGARPRPATTTCGAACRPSARTATSSSCRSAGCRRAPTRRRASSARWRWRCASPPTAWSPSAPGSTPVLVLDDVLSELDAGRATALLGHLPAGPGRDHDRVGRAAGGAPGPRSCASHGGAVVGDDVGRPRPGVAR